MGRYIVKRIGLGILSLFVLVTVTFFLTRLMPGSPFQSGNVSPDIQKAIEEEYGLDEPVLKQFAGYLRNLLGGDLGISYKKQGVRVSEVIGRAWPVTASLGVAAVCTAMVLGTLLGIWQAQTKNRWIKRGLFVGNVLGSAVPNFAVALLLLFLFGVKLKWFPVSGLMTWAHYVLPVLSLSVYPAAVTARLMSQKFQEECRKEYVIMAKARGLRWRKIVWTHVMRHAYLPVLNYMGPTAAFLLTGSFVVETIFTIPGLGREFVSSISNRDYTMIMGLTIFMGAVVILIQLVVDLICGLMNPRIRKSYEEA
ncbi:ABC transporter permease [Roseburia hominis]